MRLRGTGCDDMDANCDVVVVGGSFSGLVFAQVAALRGLRVVVLDHRSRPGARVHTTGLLVKEAADALDVPLALTRKIPGVRLYAPSGACVELTQAGYYFLATDTASLLQWLAERAAEAGAELRYANRFHGAKRAGDGGFIDIHGQRLTTRFLIGADGAHSRVAKVFGLDVNRRYLVGVEAQFPADDRVDSRFLHCFVDRRIAPGYLAWMVPGVEHVQVGLARRFPGRPDLAALLRRLAPVADFRGKQIVGWRAGTIPVSGPLSRISVPSVMLLGDAAGWVSPLTGGGIANAFHFSRRAAQIVCDHLLDDGPEPAQALAHELPRYWFKRGLRHIADHVACDWLCEQLLASPMAHWAARAIFFHPRLGARPRLPKAAALSPCAPVTDKGY